MSDENELTAYVVMGQTGEYSDHHEWPVCWTADKVWAELLVERLQRASEHWWVVNGKDRYRYTQMQKPDFDPKFDRDYTGTTYYIVEAPGAYLTFEALDRYENEHFK